MGDIFPSILPGEHPADGRDEDRPGDGPLTTISTAFESGDCPFCNEYSGEWPERHARKAHPEKWAEYKKSKG